MTSAFPCGGRAMEGAGSPQSGRAERAWRAERGVENIRQPDGWPEVHAFAEHPAHEWGRAGRGPVSYLLPSRVPDVDEPTDDVGCVRCSDRHTHPPQCWWNERSAPGRRVLTAWPGATNEPLACFSRPRTTHPCREYSPSYIAIGWDARQGSEEGGCSNGANPAQQRGAGCSPYRPGLRMLKGPSKLGPSSVVTCDSDPASSTRTSSLPGKGT